MSIIMKYHPAKKEVEFIRSQHGDKMPISPHSTLAAYVNDNKGKFVLQDHGDAFLAMIVGICDGESIVDIKVITTRIDYEDFEQMVEHFNSGTSKVRIDTELLAELPDMNETYEAVKSHGDKSIGILKKHQTKFYELDMNDPLVRKNVENFATDVQKEVDSIKEKIDAMADNNVNLCFVGVYDAGKSALINAILGYAILPEATKSLTAKMFQIQSPKPGKNVRIVFDIRTVATEVVWNDNEGTFEFSKEPNEDRSREAIQKTINENQGKFQHHQICEILKTLNTDNDVSSEVKVFFPIPLDTDRVQFTIYDTPGTDSNYGEHERVLAEALSEQTHSILVLLLHPHKLEGEGNNALLHYLKEAGKKDSKTSIDIARSLFVLNHADSMKFEDRRNAHITPMKIKNQKDDSFSIKLCDKKLFFTSARIAYAAKAIRNLIQTSSDERELKRNYDINDPESGQFYQHNRCATSEYSTKRMIELSTIEFEKAENDKDLYKVFHICSGVFALEKEIYLYGEKFAAAVRAYAIIDSVDKTLSKMNAKARILESQNQEDFKEINAEIEKLNKAISDGVRKAYGKHSIPDNKDLDDEVMTALQLNQEYLHDSFVGKPKKYIDEKLKGRFFGLGGVKYNEDDKNAIINELTSVIDKFVKDFLNKRHILLVKKRDDFIEDVKKVIKENGELSDEAKSFVLNIQAPEVDKPNIDEFGDIYNANKRNQNFLWINAVFIDKNEFIRECEAKLQDIAMSYKMSFEKDYRESLKRILGTVECELFQNLENYSVPMKENKRRKVVLEEFRDKIDKAVSELQNCKDELDRLIWRTENDGE